jgi:hypothetical protein
MELAGQDLKAGEFVFLEWGYDYGECVVDGLELAATPRAPYRYRKSAPMNSERGADSCVGRAPTYVAVFSSRWRRASAMQARTFLNGPGANHRDLSLRGEAFNI